MLQGANLMNGNQMTKARKARNAAKQITIDNDDVVIGSSVITIDATPKSEPVAMTALAIVPPVIWSTEPDTPQMDDAFWTKYKTAIRAKYNTGAKFVDLIKSLKLTPSDKDAIEKLQVMFYETWMLCILEARGMTPAKARAYLDMLLAVKGGYRKFTDPNDQRAYGATKTAWVDVRERANLKDEPTKRQPNPGNTSNKNKTKPNVFEVSDVNDFEKLFASAVQIAQLLDNVANHATQKKILTCGLGDAMWACAKALRLSAHNAKSEHGTSK